MSEQHTGKNNFDVMRLVAALFVIFHHSYALTGYGGKDILSSVTRGLYTWGSFGLDIFFVISGYLVAASAERSRTVRAYFLKRVLRIFPALIVVVLLSVFVLGPLTTTLPIASYVTNVYTYAYLVTVSLYEMPWSLPGVFTDNPVPSNVNGSLWSLPYEFTLYLVPAFLVVVRRNELLNRGGRTLFAILVLGLLVFRGYAMLSSQAAPLHQYELGFIAINLYYLWHFTILFGISALAYLYRSRLPLTIPVFSLGITALAVTIAASQTTTAALISYVVLPYAVIYLASLKSKLNDFGKYGDFSYGMYIYAFPVQQTIVLLLREHVVPLPAMLFLSIAITFLFAFASWRLIESRALSFKQRIS